VFRQFRKHFFNKSRIQQNPFHSKSCVTLIEREIGTSLSKLDFFSSLCRRNMKFIFVVVFDLKKTLKKPLPVFNFLKKPCFFVKISKKRKNKPLRGALMAEISVSPKFSIFSSKSIACFYDMYSWRKLTWTPNYQFLFQFDFHLTSEICRLPKPYRDYSHYYLSFALMTIQSSASLAGEEFLLRSHG